MSNTKLEENIKNELLNIQLRRYPMSSDYRPAAIYERGFIAGQNDDAKLELYILAFIIGNMCSCLLFICL